MVDIKNDVTKIIQIVVTLTLFFAVSGCLYVPPIGRQISEKDLSVIQVGKTTKSEVTGLLGECEILGEGRFLLCQASKDYGTLVVIGAAGGSIGGGIFTFNAEYYHLLLEFDEKNVLKRYHIEKGKSQNGRTIFSDSHTAQDKDLLRGRVVFEDTRSIFNEPLSFKSVTFSPNGKFLASVDLNSRVWLLNRDTGEKVILEKRGTIKSLTFSPDSTKLGLLGKVIRILDVSTGKELLTFDGHGMSSFWTTRKPTALAFSPDGKIVASGGWLGGVKLWDPVKGIVERSLDAHDRTIVSIAFSPDGQTLVTTAWNDNMTKIWDVNTGNMLATLTLKEEFASHKAPVAKFSPDGSMLAIHKGSRLELWRIVIKESAVESKPREFLKELANVFFLPICSPLHRVLKNSLAFSLDGQTVVASSGAAVAFDVATSTRLWRFVPYGCRNLSFSDHMKLKHQATDLIEELAFSPDGKSLAAATTTGVYTWGFQ